MSWNVRKTLYARLACCVAILVVLPGCPSGGPTPSSQPTAAEIDSAKHVAEAFLNAVKNKDYTATYGLASKSYRERLSKDQLDKKKLTFETSPKYLRSETKRWAIANTNVLDNGKQISFTGTFDTLDPGQEYVTSSDFTVIVVKEPDSGMHRVEVFTSAVYRAP